MKKIFTLIATCAVIFSSVSCDKIFDGLEGDLNKMYREDLMKTEAGVQHMLAALYSYIPMGAFSEGDKSTFLMSGRVGSKASYGQSISGWWNYSNMRNINKFIESLPEILEKGVISESTYNCLLGEAKFIRAYCYFAGVRITGGMPIVTETLDDKYDGDKNEGLYVQRSTEKKTWDFVLAELQEAADLLPESIDKGELRANKYVALALKSRAALWAASVCKYWNNRPLDPEYDAVKESLTYMNAKDANGYYQQAIDASKAIIESGKYRLYGATPGSVEEAVTNLIDLFQTIKYDEYIFGKTYNTGVSTSDNGLEAWAPFQGSPTGWTKGTGSVTANMVDAFADRGANGETIKGQIKTNNGAEGEDYVLVDPYAQPGQIAAMAKNLVRYETVDGPFLNKDARFKAWIVWPGSTFRNKSMVMQAGMITPDGTVLCLPDPEGGNIGVEKNGVTYYPYGSGSKVLSDYSAFYWIGRNFNDTNAYEYCFGIRKYVDQKTQATYTQSPWYDIRYAEILLNYAEAVAESGLGDKALATKCLNDVHVRAGFKPDLELTVDNVLDEVKVEFFAENHWQGVLQRRRAYYNSDLSKEQNKLEYPGYKSTFLPMVDLSGEKVAYVFPRAYPLYTSASKAGSVTFKIENKNYYGSVSNYGNNHIVNNNTK